MFKFIGLLMIAIPTLALSSATSEVKVGSEQLPAAESKFAVNYQFIKRSLNDSESAQSLRQDTGEILPSSLVFEQHLFGVRYQLAPRWAVELGGSYLKSEININGYKDIYMGPFLGTKRIDINIDSGSSGLSDSRAGVLYTAYRDRHNTVTTSMHFNLPTGDIDIVDQERMLPYSGQLGSGTFDLMPKVAWKFSHQGWMAGSDLRYTLRTGRNDQDYRMGNQTLFNLYGGYSYKRMISALLKGRIRDWSESDDYRLTPANQHSTLYSSIFNDPYLESGTRWEVLAIARTGIPLPNKLGVILLEGGLPIYQDQRAGDAQLETNWYLNTSLNVAF